MFFENLVNLTYLSRRLLEKPGLIGCAAEQGCPSPTQPKFDCFDPTKGREVPKVPWAILGSAHRWKTDLRTV